MRASAAPGTYRTSFNMRSARARCIQIGPDDLNIDRSGQSKVQNLGHNVHRHHIERHARVLVSQHAAQPLDILLAGMMIAGQLHLDICVGGAYRRGGRVGKIQRGVRQADVVENRHHFVGRNLPADGLLHVIAKRSRFFDARTRVGAHVNDELAESTDGKKSCPSSG